MIEVRVETPGAGSINNGLQITDYIVYRRLAMGKRTVASNRSYTMASAGQE
jgi:hypothetical protein